MTHNVRIAMLVAASGGIVGTASAQLLDGQMVTGSGATLQEQYFRTAANTNDFIDADGDGVAGSLGSLFPDQLAPVSGVTQAPPYAANVEMLFQYRVTGSGNGIAEFDKFASIFDQNPDATDDNGDGNPNNDLGNFNRADAIIWNRNNLRTSGSPTLPSWANSAHRGAAPAIANGLNSYRSALLNLGNTQNGFTVDFAASDVPVAWFAIASGTPSPINNPTFPGYGSNPRLAVDAAGNNTTWNNLLRPLSVLNTNVASPNANTVYEFALAQTPVAAMVNYGVGIQQIFMSDLRHLSATGRRLTGENLMKVTRDSGSGTRNAFMNAIGIDPSFGVGENIGVQTNSSANDRLGPAFQPSNKGGSSRVEGTVINHRLAIGHTGVERGVPDAFSNSDWLVTGRADVLAVISDIKGGTTAARPTAANVLNGGANGYNVTGPATISVRGNPRNAPASLGGWGWDPSEIGPSPFSGPAPANPGLSAYMNNLLRSLDGFITVPAAPENDFMPAEQLARLFPLDPSPNFVSEINPSTPTQPIPLVSNPNFNINLNQFQLNDPSNELNNASLATFNTTIFGRVPTRTSGINYTDNNGVANNFYRLNNGGTIAYDAVLNTVWNRISGDFNNDGVRNASDTAGLIAAWRFRNGGPAWQPGTDASPEILGDFDGDGNFTAADVRYWADGLVLKNNGLDILPVQRQPNGTFVIGNGVPEATLDRKEGYTLVDNAFGGNFFGTTLATGAYDNGDSRGDVAGLTTRTTRGYRPIGHDGVVNAADIQYVITNQGSWQDLTVAVNIDLSADMNADLVVDCDDVTEIVVEVLDSQLGDVNLDGVRDAADLAIVNLTGDGQVDSGDLSTFIVAFLGGNLIADLTNDGQVDSGDLSAFISGFLTCS
jgi:hypothetical protein